MQDIIDDLLAYDELHSESKELHARVIKRLHSAEALHGQLCNVVDAGLGRSPHSDHGSIGRDLPIERFSPPQLEAGRDMHGRRGRKLSLSNFYREFDAWVAERRG